MNSLENSVEKLKIKAKDSSLEKTNQTEDIKSNIKVEPNQEVGLKVSENQIGTNFNNNNTSINSSSITCTSNSTTDQNDQKMYPDHIKEVRLAVIGNVDSGKSTLVGCLTKNIKDDGRGYARQFVFNYQHEKENGRTKSFRF